MPGKLGQAAKRIGDAAASAAKPAKGSPKMDVLKKKIAPMKTQEFKKTMPLKTVAPKAKTPEFMKPGYKPGSILRGYTKYA